MHFWNSFPFIRYAIALTGGILIYHKFGSFWSGDVVILLIAIVIFSLTFALSALIRRFNLWFIQGLLLTGCFVVFGTLITKLNDDRQKANHYSGFMESKSFRGKVISDHTERTKYYRYELELDHVMIGDSVFETTGVIYLYQRKNDHLKPLFYGDIVEVNKSFFPIPFPQNPEEFDYRKYLAYQNIHAHAFVDGTDIDVRAKDQGMALIALAYTIRQKSRELITYHVPDDRERAILMALLVGVKDHLDNETKTAYASAGAMHVLAVSGLHVGIVYYLLALAFGPIKKYRSGRVLFKVVVISLIWIYALVTGFSASVLRAATMFSVVILTEDGPYKSNVYNSLGIAAFVLLLFDPNLAFSVGFQLSFAAVIGIVFLHPILYRQLFIKSRVLDYLWSITCVSIAAQAATFPLAVYYFHQFPTYFLVSNLIVIPSAMVLLISGITMLLVGLISPLIAGYIGYFLSGFTWLINELVNLLQLLPRPIVDWLYFDRLDTFLVYAIVLLIAFGLSQRSYAQILLALGVLLFFNIRIGYKRYHQANQQRLVIYEMLDNTAIDLIHGRGSRLLIDSYDPENQEVVGFQVNPNRLAHGLPRVRGTAELLERSRYSRAIDFGYLIQWNEYNLIILKEMVTDFRIIGEVDVLLVCNPKIRIPKELEVKTVILGPEFRPWQVQRLKKYLSATTVHSLTHDGYFTIDHSKELF